MNLRKGWKFKVCLKLEVENVCLSAEKKKDKNLKDISMGWKCKIILGDGSS